MADGSHFVKQNLSCVSIWNGQKCYRKVNFNVNAMTDVIALMVTIWPGDTKVYYTLFSCSQIIIHVCVWPVCLFEFTDYRKRISKDREKSLHLTNIIVAINFGKIIISNFVVMNYFARNHCPDSDISRLLLSGYDNSVVLYVRRLIHRTGKEC